MCANRPRKFFEFLLLLLLCMALVSLYLRHTWSQRTNLLVDKTAVENLSNLCYNVKVSSGR